jgi:hypothetical protein
MKWTVILWQQNNFRKAAFKTKTLCVMLLVSFSDGANVSAANAKAVVHFFIHKTNTL